MQGGVEDELGVFEILGNDVFVDPEQYAKNYQYNGAKEYNVGTDPKYRNLNINLRKYDSTTTQKSAKLTTVFYDQGANIWAESVDGGIFLIAPRNADSPLWEDPSAELNAKAILITFFGEKEVDKLTKQQVFDLIQSKFPIQ